MMNDELNLVREGLFGPTKQYITLLSLTGEHALSLIKSIARNGAESVLTTLLITANLEPSTKSSDKPWDIFSNEYALGDYHLVWSQRDQSVAIYEINLPDDIYSNI